MSMNRIRTITIAQPELFSRVACFGIATLILTTVHHAYGAYIFAAPWRLHVALISLPVAVAIAVSRSLYQRHPHGALGATAFWIVIALTLLVSVALFGVFEGTYNHVLKNALYFGGASPEVLNHLFPAPTYELPSDLFFEITGMLHVIPAGMASWSLFRLFHPRTPISMVSAAA